VSRRLRDVHRLQVDAFQRAQILAAMAELACEEGAEQATVTKVLARARLSRRRFYELFADRHDCLRAVVEETVDRAAARVAGTYRGEGPWVERLRAGLFELLSLIDEEHGLAKLCLSRLYAADPVLSACRRCLLDALIAAVDQGRAGIPAGRQPPPLTAEGAVGAVGSILHRRLLNSESGCARELLGPLMSVLVLPYLGLAAAHRELSRPAPVRAPPLIPVAEPPRLRVRDRPLRVTYRTARVLETIAARPDISNRAVATAAGVKDQGQISKLLARLERLGLAENTGGPGGANAWQLTPEGHALCSRLAMTSSDCTV